MSFTNTWFITVTWLIVLLLLQPNLSTCREFVAITPNHPIEDGDLLVSSNRTFALGFFSPGNSVKRYIGVWYHQVPNQTVVWVANLDNPIPVNDTSGILAIHGDGGLVIYGTNRSHPVWSTNVTLSSHDTSIAKLLDTDHTRRSSLNWEKRFEIIIGIARGILYLHQDSRLRIIHRDLKTSNVLLDAEMNPKISDFGMARIIDVNQAQDKTNRIVGTYGYMSPEYAVFGRFSTKSDVFSFGIILLEIVTGTKNNGSYRDDPSMNLIGHVWGLWREDRALEVVDSTLESYNSDEVMRCFQVALLCVQEDAKDRPDMAVVVFMLSGEASPLSPPKQPAYVFRETDADPLILKGSHSMNDLTVTTVEAR